MKATPGISRTTQRGENGSSSGRRRATSRARSRSGASAKQGELAFRSWGGARRGSGRKPKGERALVPHDARPAHKARFPVLVTSRLLPGLPSLRHAREAARIRAALAGVNLNFRVPEEQLEPAEGSGRSTGIQGARTTRANPGGGRDPAVPQRRAVARFQVVHHSIQSNHVHLIVEATDRKALTSGMRGLLIRIAHALNKLWGRSGRVFADRFHERELVNPLQVRNALVYVLQNLRKHGICIEGPDPLSSGPGFDGWDTQRMTTAPRADPRTPLRAGGSGGPAALSLLRAARLEQPAATTWLLHVGWQKHGRIDPRESPRRR
jgi:hypothetical protein